MNVANLERVYFADVIQNTELRRLSWILRISLEVHYQPHINSEVEL